MYACMHVCLYVIERENIKTILIIYLFIYSITLRIYTLEQPQILSLQLFMYLSFCILDRDIAYRIIPGKWTEKTGLHLLVGCLSISNLSIYLSVIYPSMKLCLLPPFNIIKGFPGQPYGNDCGIFMLMVRCVQYVCG